MINGAHLLLYSEHPEADRVFFRDVLGWPYVDVGDGWLIFSLPPAEIALHPVDDTPRRVHAGHAMIGSVLYLMCDDVRATMAMLAERDVRCTEIEQERWGIRTTIVLPGGGEVGLYQPMHETALGLATPRQP